VIVGLVSGSLSYAAGGVCTPDLAAVGACGTVSNDGKQVDLGASTTRPGSGSPRPGDSSAPSLPPVALPPQAPADPADCLLDRCDFNYEVETPPDVTLADLASFRPARPSLDGEPSGFGVVGMPANIFAAASEQRIPGTLLGWDVTVRFVPAAFVFHYGDGSAVTTASGGASWERLGQAQFTPTATSHVYLARGTYPVSVDVRYTASVDFGSGAWRPVAGFVTATTAGYDVEVVEVRTALVDKTCAENPRGAGC
jgi:hypothetical protein